MLIGILCGLSANAQSWSLTGNSGTTPGTSFIGTTDNKDLVFKTNSTEKVRVYNNGNIDFNPPVSSLAYSYLFPFATNYKFNGSTTFSIGESSNSFIIYSDPANATSFRIDGDNQIVFIQEDAGKVVIGSKNDNLNICTSCNEYRLFVKDGIKTEKVKVEIAAENGWADYVFKKDYKLMPLKEVESYINTNGHLPEVPSTEEAIQNGIELKEMNILLLKKVEELTLHLIEQNKEITSQKYQINNQNERLEVLEKLLTNYSK